MSIISKTQDPQAEDFEVRRIQTPSEFNAYLKRLKSLITRSLSGFEEYGGVIDAVYRRLANFERIYQADGSAVLVMLDLNEHLIGTAGIGTLAGLPVSEGMGEIRDIVISAPYRGKGLGAKLLRETLKVATSLGYSRIYSETTPQMLTAQKLFRSFGFAPLPSQKYKSKSAPDFVRINKAAQTKQAKKISENDKKVEVAYPAYFVLDGFVNLKDRS